MSENEQSQGYEFTSFLESSAAWQHWLQSNFSAEEQTPQEPLVQAVPAVEKDTPARKKSNWVYIAWFLFYFIFFSVITFGIAIPFYIITVILAFSPIAEKLWRRVSGVRPLRLKSEKDRLHPLFAEVYVAASYAELNLSGKIRLYIKEDMSINVFAFGKGTLVLTRGCIELLNDDCLKGLMAHEFGHFAHRDTEAVLLSTVSNFVMSYIMTKMTDRKTRYDSENKGGFFKWILDIFYYLFRAIDLIGELILKRTSRRNEYRADSFALKSGLGKNLTDVLLKIYSVSVSKPQSVKEQMKSTHPDITLRIERLEETLYH